jgi:hypothetical protein
MRGSWVCTGDEKRCGRPADFGPKIAMHDVPDRLKSADTAAVFLKRHFAVGAKPSLRCWSLRELVVSNIVLIEAFHPILAESVPRLVIKKS